nr:DEAD/DEAH box helicase [Candidatus Omnitrophota bacterium]
AAASDVIFSQISFDKYLVGGGGVWQTFREEIGEAKEYPEPTKTIKVGEENFILIRKRSGGGHTVFTLNQEKFERLARLKGWAFKATVPDAAASDVIFSQISFDKYLIGGGGVWQTFREEIGEAKEYPEPTKTIKVGEENFILIRKQSAGRIVFTLNQERFEQLVRLKKWPPRSKIPDEDIHDVVFLPKSFDEYLIGGARIWQIFKQEIGEADEYPEPTKTIKVGEENFILVRKQSGKRIVFTLNQKRFEQLMRLKGWLFKVPDIEATDVIFSRPGFGKYLKYEGKIWQTFRQEIGEANEYPEPTKTIKVGKENFILIRKRSGGGHTVFTLNQEKFERLARLKGWAFKAKVPDVEANDVVFSANSFQLYFTGAKGIWERLKKEVGEAAEFTEPTKTLKVGEEIFTLVRKRSGAYVVFTLDKERFEQLARLKDWPLKKVNNANAIEEYIENHLEIQDAIASTIEDPEALYAYLMFTDVPVEMARGIVIESFHGIRGAARTISDLDDYNNYTETDDQMTLEEVPSETADLRFTMRGKVPAGYSQVQIYVDRDRIVDVDENGHFTVNFILERGKVAQFGFFGINEEAQTRTKSTVITVSQTSPPKDIGAIFDELLSKKEELQVKIFNNKEQLKYLTKRMEISALKHFTEDEKEGFLYLDQKIEQMKSPFMKQLYRFIKEKFEEIDAFEVEDLRKSEKLYFYEKYAIRETTERMNDPNNPSKGVILALEQGLGKTLVALSAVRKDPNGAAIIVPNAVVTTWGEQEGHFFEDKETETHIITGTGVQKAKKIEEAGNKSKVVNLEYIRDKKHVMGLNKNPKQVLVLDESQFISRPGSQQSEGATDIKRRFTILISATPFANTEAARSVIKFLERGNKGLEDSKVFKRLFDTNDPESLRLLHFWFNQYLIRIKKRDVFKEYDKSKPLEEQKDRLPSKEFISPEELGEYELTPEQADAQLQMFTDWLGWVQRKIASGGVKTEDDAIIQKRERDENYFSKMHSLRQMSNTPKYIGIDQESPKLKSMDKIVEKEVINKNGKVVIFAQYRNQVKEYLSRYADLNAISYYGDTEHEKPTIKGYLATEDGQKLRLFKKKNRYEYDIDLNGLLIEDPKGDPITSLDYNRLVFQNDPTAKVLIATYDSGAVGVTFTAADAVIFDDLARDYTVQYQAEDRANRIDNLRKKYAVRYYNLIAKYPESFINKVRDLYQVTDSYNSKKLVTADEITDEMEQDDNLEIESLYDLYFSNGTYDQVHFKNLQAQKRIFELILDGLQDQKDMDLITNKRLKEKFPGLFTVTKHGKIIDEQPDEEFKEIEERIENGNGDGNGNGENKDSAMISNGEQGSKPQDVGGIDFNPNNINLEIKNDGKDISIPIDEQQIQMDHIGGFTPVIINITSILNFPQVLGLKENEEDVNVEYSLSKDSER